MTFLLVLNITSRMWDMIMAKLTSMKTYSKRFAIREDEPSATIQFGLTGDRRTPKGFFINIIGAERTYTLDLTPEEFAFIKNGV